MSEHQQPKEQQRREGKAYYHSDITPEVLENIQIGDWIRGIGDISCPFDQRVVQTVGAWLRMHDTRSRPHPAPPQGMTTDELWDYSNDLAEVAARKAREDFADELKKDLKTRFVSSSNNWSKGRNSGLIECCNIIDEHMRATPQSEQEQPR